MKYLCIISCLLLLATVKAIAKNAQIDQPKTVLDLNFAKTRSLQSASFTTLYSSLTSDPSLEADGSPSLVADTRKTTGEWNEYFHLKEGVLKANTAYVISFDYKPLAAAKGARFYALFRRPGAIAPSLTYLSGKTGEAQRITLSFPPADTSDYALILGIQNQGAIAINNIVIRTDPAHTPRVMSLPVAKRTWNSPGHATYYIDSLHGDDSASGKSPSHAWRTLRKVNTGVFGPGDKILLRRGDRWSGFLYPGGSGAKGNPAVLGDYGFGSKPRIDGGEGSLATVYLYNSEYWTIRNLDITNSGPYPVRQLSGVIINVDNYGTAHDITLDGLHIHDVSGSDEANPAGGSGIRILRGESGRLSRYDGLLIENCHLVHVDRNGILMDGNVWRTHWFPNLHVVIRRNLLEDIGGDGIVPIACDGALVEYNTVRGARERTDSYAVGIYPWSCDNTVIQFNDVSGVKGTKDGQGYDCDFNCRNTLMQYNYSHDNQGGFMLICDDGDFKAPMNAGNTGSVIRYNVSVNDGFHTFTLNGPCDNTKIYNNVIYVGKGQTLYALASGNWGGAWASDTLFSNNIFYIDSGSKATFDLGGMTNIVFRHNAYWGDIVNRPNDPYAILSNPLLVKPGGMNPSDYAPAANSPCLNAGEIIAGNGGRDFDGAATPLGAPPSVGAFERSHNPLAK